MTKKVLVTGADGQLGQTLEELIKDKVTELDFIFASKKDLDITEKENLSINFNYNKFDYCINCAAYTNVELAEKAPEVAYNINAEGVKNLAEVCSENNTILIHISTDYVFDGEKNTPYQVDDETNPINVYGKSKLLGESYIKELMTDYFIVRTSWLYSKKYGHNFYKTILKKAKKERQLAITTEQMGSPTNTKNLSKFIMKLILGNNKNFGIFHFCDELAMTWYDFALQILSENNLSDSINLVKVNNYRMFARRPKYSVLKNSTFTAK